MSSEENYTPPLPNPPKRRGKKQNHREIFTLKEKRNFNICFIQTAIVQPVNLTMYYVFYYKYKF
jgi:hypothetical protein